MPQRHLTIKERPPAERPRERLLAGGESVLSPAELLGIILRAGRPGETSVELATRLLADYGSLRRLLAAPASELARAPGLGPARAAELKAVFGLACRLASELPPPPLHLGTPAAVVQLLELEMSALEQEQLRLVLLNVNNTLLRIVTLYQGHVSAVQTRTAELFREAIRYNAPALILVHNHPSGDPTPSRSDVQVTEEAVRAGQLLDIGILDHLIIGGGRFTSLRQLGLGFGSPSTHGST